MSNQPKNILIDSTVLNTVQECGEKCNLTHNHDLRPAGPKPNYFEEGDLLHQMFEFYNLVLKDSGTEILYDNEKWPRLVSACSDYGQFASTTMDLLPAECSEVIFQFSEYVKHTRMDGVTVLEVEKPFIIELYKDEDINIFYSGKVDRFTDTPHFGKVIRDYKSGGQRGKVDTLSNQFTSYTYAMNTDLIIVDKVGFQKTLKPEQRFENIPLYYNDFKKEEWKQDTIWWVKMYLFYQETGTWPRNRTSCNKWGGCQFCEICDANDEEIRQHILKTKFVIGDHWDVTAVLTKSETSPEHLKMAEIAGNYGIDLVF